VFQSTKHFSSPTRQQAHYRYSPLMTHPCAYATSVTVPV